MTGLPREVVITDNDIREAISGSLAIFVDAVKEVLESTPPEVVSDIMRRGLALAGGGALIRGLDQFLAKELEIPVHLADDPLLAVVRGTGIILDDLDHYRDVLIDNEEELSPRLWLSLIITRINKKRLLGALPDLFFYYSSFIFWVHWFLLLYPGR